MFDLSKTMKLFVALLFPIFSFCQRVDTTIYSATKMRTQVKPHKAPFLKTNSVEICDNNIDDDNNGLVDMKDFSCYYSSFSTDCIPSKVVWVSCNWQLLWVDLETGLERYVGPMDQMDDIEWASDGKLYGINNRMESIVEIDPNTAETKALFPFNGFYSSNAMTADNAGNLYLATTTTDRKHDVKRINIATGQVSIVVDLRKYSLTSSGDLSFLNGYLYLTCEENKIAQINTNTGAVQTFTIINSTIDRNFGLFTMGDGYLYYTSVNQIFKLDPLTMQGSLYYTFKYPDIFILGASNYTDQCNSPGCKARVKISVETNTPYCSSQGVLLKATGKGILGDKGYTWSLPDGTSAKGDSLVATISGKYMIRYHTIPDTCRQFDSIFLNIMDPPIVSFGQDSVLCKGSTLHLQLTGTKSYTSYTWQNGNSSTSHTVSSPGWYTVEASNDCGRTRDSILIKEVGKPLVFLGNDTVICPGSSLQLYNRFDSHTWNKNKWWDASEKDTVVVKEKQAYWLEIKNVCGTTRDSVLVDYKDSCSCFPLYPQVQLGPDFELCSFESGVIKNKQHDSRFQYSWQNGSNDQEMVVKTPGIYWVDVSTYCETKRDSIIILKKKKGCDRAVFVPTAFTPNRDNKNDRFHPIVMGTLKEYYFAVYNRWGEKVFETKEINEGWDGNFKGKNQNNDVFVWICHFQFEGMEKKTEKGSLILIR